MPRAETRFFWYPAKADPGSGHWVMSCLQECGNDLVDLPPSVAVAGNKLVNAGHVALKLTPQLGE